MTAQQRTPDTLPANKERSSTCTELDRWAEMIEEFDADYAGAANSPEEGQLDLFG
jgi:hypothetical protein